MKAEKVFRCFMHITKQSYYALIKLMWIHSDVFGASNIDLLGWHLGMAFGSAWWAED